MLVAARPSARLLVAGSVSRGLSIPAPEGVCLLGVVDDLAPLYRDAGVVISPLRTGSGLKIKLIEAMAAGKAIVGTGVTLQGVADIAGHAIVAVDRTEDFAEAVAGLLVDQAARLRLGEAALSAAREAFSPEAAIAELLRYIDERAGRAARAN